MGTKKLVKILQISVFAAIAVIITFLEIPVFFVPGVYKIDFSDVVVLISGFSLGPLAGVLTEFLKIVIKILIKGSTTLGLGDSANFIIGISLILPSSIFYKKNRTFKGAWSAMMLGTICSTIVSLVVNYFILIPAYQVIFSISESAIISFANAVNPLIVNKFTFILFAVLPFNLIKYMLICIFVLIIYKKLSFFINDILNKFVK